VKLGVQIADFAWSGGPPQMGERLAEVVRTAEDVGIDLICVADHMWQGPYLGGVEQPELECMVTLGVIAANTRLCRLAPLVAGVHFRQPALLVKSITTLDVLSGGRAMLGIGAGWFEDEARGLGFPFPAPAERLEMLDEALQISLRMWHGEHGDERPFEGKHYRLERPIMAPQSLSRPHPPILIGGSGEKVTLRLVARYADACSLYPGPDVVHKLDVLRRHCESEGRDYDAIEKTCAERYDVGPDRASQQAMIERLRTLADVGIDTVIGILPAVDAVETLEILGREIIPAVAESAARQRV
jgi:F420-dependent oxidoreductase-like protein